LEYAVCASEFWLIKDRYLVLRRPVGNNLRKEVKHMQITDAIADMLTRVRNAGTAKHESVDIPASNIKKDIARILLDEGYVKNFELIEDGKQGLIRIVLKYTGNKQNVISGIKRISKPGLRVYADKDELPKVLGGLGIAVISTSKGIMTDKRARTEGVGGEVLAFIW